MKIGMCIAVSVALCRCGPSNDNNTPNAPPVVEVIPSLKEVYDEFVSDCGSKYGADLSNKYKLEYIQYEGYKGELKNKYGGNTVGMCLYWTSNNVITKSNITISHMDSAIKTKAVLYHELGHCVLKLAHTEQNPQTMMSPIMGTDEFYKENWDELVKDMCYKYYK